MSALPEIVPPPLEVRLNRRERHLELSWPEGHRSRISCLTLRMACACASCTQAQRRGRLTLYDVDITIDKVALFGVSGLQLFFSDGHDRGLYPWAYLRELGEAQP
ncbi:DUF971 domain-containing protein [Halomonas heilongjiangensis]|uniref:Gamma-butyrobetaine hydroxylase-like N-terminal domain-containing protein n=1 Tax=Halomonas heilongjiangensis TaxID=1387883 RepID=A0A2N7TIU7_9GAMM|nr:DUF971 domain-containing protein [Halomonas heilongjiangensis]PMR68106.1 hypothetical protein C1H66_16960 [Halomonas heilongjiangensis]PXX92142.1 hypothetical protein CR158_05640 [Halomonas heilongjiangensis]